MTIAPLGWAPGTWGQAEPYPLALSVVGRTGDGLSFVLDGQEGLFRERGRDFETTNRIGAVQSGPGPRADQVDHWRYRNQRHRRLAAAPGRSNRGFGGSAGTSICINAAMLARAWIGSRRRKPDSGARAFQFRNGLTRPGV